MQLRSARLCLDCDEVHDSQQCPACASETFAFLTRWVPVPDRPQSSTSGRPPTRPRPGEAEDSEALVVYREMLQPEQDRGGTWRTLRRGALGLALFGLAGWAWRHNARQDVDAGQSDEGAKDQR